MNPARRFFGLFQDSPTFGHDRSNLLSAFTIGTAGLLLNGAVMIMALPLMLDPHDRGFRTLTENVEFGQLLALILLGGATGFATLLIPMRLATVFWGPRMGRYFDQVVLSGISPIRFVIGKVMSQNLFLALVFFMLVPYFVLALTLGGVNPVVFLAGVILVWLYCMQLALVTLWVSLYLNEGLSAIIVISCGFLLAGLGFIPMTTQPFVVTPIPSLMQPVYSSIPTAAPWVSPAFFPVFASCVLGMTTVIVVALVAVHLGPLYGIIRDNSTFGEVVRKGDSGRTRRFRMRLHIQRSSEIAFFYENRGDAFRRYEGLIRWGFGLLALLLSLCLAYGLLAMSYSEWLKNWGGTGTWWAYELHAFNLTILGFAIALALIVFSHARNSIYASVSFVAGKRVEVSRLDTIAFLLFSTVSVVVAVVFPFWFDAYFASPLNDTVFPVLDSGNGRLDLMRAVSEGSAVLLVSGIVLYAMHRFACLFTWLKATAFVAVAAFYGVFVCLLPFLFAMIAGEFGFMMQGSVIENFLLKWVLCTPTGAIPFLFNEFNPSSVVNESTVPFYPFHCVLLFATIVAIRRQSQKLCESYLSNDAEETE